jgi:hypothetical protein
MRLERSLLFLPLIVNIGQYHPLGLWDVVYQQLLHLTDLLSECENVGWIHLLDY